MSSSPSGSPTPWQVGLSMAGGALALVSYLVVCHIATARQWPWAVWLYLAPLLSVLLPWLAARVGGWPGRAVALGVLGLVALALHHWPLQRSWLFVTEHACTNLFLCGLFGRTLFGQREPLVTRFARMLRGHDMPPEVLAYTRGATLAWALFFAGVASVSVGLFLLAPLVVWSAFANLVSASLVGLMFVGEYAVRRWRLRGIRHTALLDAVRAFRQPWSEPPPGQTPS